MTDETRTYIHILTQAICSNHAATSPVTDIDSLIHRLGGRIEEMRPFDDLYDGTAAKCGDNQFCLRIAAGMPAKKRNFVISRELGHVILHMGFQTNPQLWQEQRLHAFRRFPKAEQTYQANEFAMSLLNPTRRCGRVV